VAGLKQRFQEELLELEHMPSPNVVVTAVRLPTGAVEVITNHQELKDKLKYLNEAYDDEFKLKRNSDVQIVGYIIA
jgi:hypothetical protein